ncbi:MAG: peptidoglycan editing factor PgeF [Hyphomonadaceae bacterium]|nr:peptidoglycan editing factor PgeF [Hyphomonadaceae bacterium]
MSAPPHWRARSLAKVRHAFFGRTGGVSTGIYAGLNAGTGSHDDPDAVAENRRRIAAAFGADLSQLVGVHQVHSADAVFVERPWAGERPHADALVSKTPGLALSVLTADCAPVLLADARAQVIGAAHAGWKGAIGGVLEATVALMEKHGAERARIGAAIGPCIHQPSYEVGPEFHARFTQASADYAAFFLPGIDGKFQFDLPGFCAFRLRALGVSAEIVDADTYPAADTLFSHRRSVHAREPDYGRNCAAIALS